MFNYKDFDLVNKKMQWPITEVGKSIRNKVLGLIIMGSVLDILSSKFN